MKNITVTLIASMLVVSLSFSHSSMLIGNTVPVVVNEVTIVGGGIAGALHAYHAHQEALKSGNKTRVTIFEKNKSISDTTTSNIVPSFTIDEIMSVVPRGKALVEKLQLAFNQPGGIRVDDVAHANDSVVAHEFIQQAETYSYDLKGYHDRTQTLLALGKMSMDMWQTLYEEADAELKSILTVSNYNPCRETMSRVLHDGYRVDLIYNVPHAATRAEGMRADYKSLGYHNCALLSPSEVVAIDPFLTAFCKDHSEQDASGTLQWHNDSVALWRPGGCLDTKIFLPKFYDYLKKVMGSYVDESGKTCDSFQILYDSEVKELKLETCNDKTVVTGLNFGNGLSHGTDEACATSSYVICPGEAVGTLRKLGLKEPSYAGFAGVSLLLNIPIPADKLEEYSAFSHCMEVHQEGVVLAWQARFIDGKIFIGVAGTKAFYGDQRPNKDQAFANDRNLLQLNMINNVLPQFISLALGRDTHGQTLTQADMDILENNGIAKRWAGVRAVAFDGFPTLGTAYTVDGVAIDNAIVTTHLGSGGGSFGPAAVAVSCSAAEKNGTRSPLVGSVLHFAQATRQAE